MKHPKPEPVVVTTLCSLCGENWESHGEDPSTLDCIRLLKAKAARPYVAPYIINRPYVVPQPYTWPSYPQITYGTSYISSAGSLNGTTTTTTNARTTTNVVYMTPRTDDGPDTVGAVA